MRDLVATTAADLAFRRYLSGEHILHTIQGSFPYANPGSYPVLLRGRRCMMKSSLIFGRKTIHSLRSQPSRILASQAQLTVDDLETDPHLDDDLLVFALVLALITRRPSELENALAAGQPICLIHTLPENWANPLPNLPLRDITFKTDCDQELMLDMGGRDPEGNFLEETLSLKPRTRTRLEQPFQSLAYLRSSQPVLSQGGLSNPACKITHIFRPGQWGNIWIYGLEIFLIGYTTQAEFRRQGALQINENQDPVVATGKMKSLPYGRLHPLAGLFNWVDKP
jgi:hypothetical protein